MSEQTIRTSKSSFDLFRIYSEVWRYKSFLLNWTQRDLQVRYKGSVLGVLWNFLTPLASLLVYFFVFSRISGSDVPNFLIFLFSGLTAWLFFVQSITNAPTALLNSSNIMSKVYFPLEILIISNIISNLVNFFVSFGLVLLVILVMKAPLSLNILWVPVIALLQAWFLYSSGLLFSCIGTIIKDLSQIITTALGLLMFITPIFYKAESITLKYAWLLKIQPLAALITLYRNVIHEATYPNWILLGYIIIFNIVWYFFCHYIFNKLRSTVYDLI
jgi:lipopolysaccharide transport system permease protein